MAIVAKLDSSYYVALQPSVGRGLLVVCVSMDLLSSLMSCQVSVRNNLRLVGDWGDGNGLVGNSSWNWLGKLSICIVILLWRRIAHRNSCLYSQKNGFRPIKCILLSF